MSGATPEYLSKFAKFNSLMKPDFYVRHSYDVFKTKTRRKLVDEIDP